MRKCDGAGAAYGIQISQARASVHKAGTSRAERTKIARQPRDRDVIEHSLGCRSRGAAAKAVQLAGATMGFAAGASPFQEFSKVVTGNEMRPGTCHRGEARLDPAPHCLAVDAVEAGYFLNRVTAVDLGPVRIEALTGHRSNRPCFDEPADVLDPPSGDAGTEFDRAGVASGLHAGPPRRFAHGNWAARGKDCRKPDEASLGKCRGL